MTTPSYLEDLDSQIPAIQLLSGLGWQYLPRDEALALRDGRIDRVVLGGILRPWLARHNRIEVKGESHPFTEANIAEAVRRLVDVPYDGLVRTNEAVYHLLTLGTSLDQTIGGDRKGRQLQYIDWHNPANNLCHVADEFSVERTRSHETNRPDLVLFVNGIPLVVIECKRRDKDTQAGKRQVEFAVEQLIGYQRDEAIPRLFAYAQILLATSVNEVLYGATGTPRKFWSIWREEGEDDHAVVDAANRPLSAETIEQIFAPHDARDPDGSRSAREHFDALWGAGGRLPTTQDGTLRAMLRPARLLDLAYGYVVFDAGVRKIARYQQYFAVQSTMARVATLREGRRTGGVIWHTTGSGKSLTMVMLAKALALHPGIVDPRVVLVTDRIDLDDQIWRTFEACGKSAARARTGEHLRQLIVEGKAGVITTVIDKFRALRGKRDLEDANPNIFVLVDESHRSNYGPTAALMRIVFPNGCYIGFTGTPLLKPEKSTAQQFGGFIHSYTMRQAVEDQAVAPLLYEGRIAELEQNEKALEAWFERVTANLSERQKADLKRKMAAKGEINKVEQRIKMLAFDIGEHYRQNFQGTGFKAQLAADSRASALRYRQFMREFDAVEAEVVMSQPDMREGGESVEETDRPEVRAFWDEMMKRFGSEDEYNKQLLASFARDDGLEVLIVIDKLLVGFDEPRNTVLYIDKPLKEHSILQAIARVNRILPGKDFGYIVDYRGVLGELNEAMNTYEALGGFDPDDVDLEGAVIDTRAEVARLAQRHSDVWAVFREIQNRKDVEAFEQLLAAEDIRQSFYDALRNYQATLTVALATEHFYAETPSERIKTCKDDLKFFRSLRGSVKQRYAEAVDYAQYETQIRKIMDSHIQAPDVGVITELVNIFDVEKFDQEVEKRHGAAAKADTMASRLKKTIHEKMEEDPVFYRKFAELVQLAINAYRQARIDEAEYLKRIQSLLDTVRRGHESDLPQQLKNHREAQAYYGVIEEVLVRDMVAEDDQHREVAAGMALDIEEIIEQRKIRDWATNEDVVKSMQNDIDDYLYDSRDQHRILAKTQDIDDVMERCLRVARKLAGA